MCNITKELLFITSFLCDCSTVFHQSSVKLVVWEMVMVNEHEMISPDIHLNTQPINSYLRFTQEKGERIKNVTWQEKCFKVAQIK